MIRPLLLLLLASSASPAFSSTPALPADPTPLIARAHFFGNASKSAGRISPDGKWLSWIAPRDGVANVWVAPLGAPDQARPLSRETVRPIRTTFWSPDSTMILFINDDNGDENFLLYGVDVHSGEQKALTPFEKTRVQIVKISRQVKDRILVAINNRDPRWHDVYSLDLASGKLTLVLQNDGYENFIADEQLNLRLARKARTDGGVDYVSIAGGKAGSAPVARIGLDDALSTIPLGFSSDGNTLYWSDSRGRNTSALLAQDVGSGRTSLIGSDRRADIREAMYDTVTGKVQAYQVEYLKREHVAVDRRVRDDLAFLKKAAGGDFTVLSRTDADDKWIVAIDRVTAPPSTWLYERAGRKLSPLFVVRPELEGAPLVQMFPREIKSRDGLTLVSYLSLPKSADPQGDGKADRPAPLVLYVHGGAWARDYYGSSSIHQWLANRGYAVLSVNFRGSNGFGKRFISAANLQWGRKMQDDLLDAVDWAVRNGVTTRDRVAIMGGSYGGYATLAGMAFTPDAFACGVDIVGPSNLLTLLETIPPYWESFKQQFYRRMGDPTTEAGRALLRRSSPLYFADQIKRPLLIGQGANDPRVNARESDQIVESMKAKNIPVTYVVFPDEGHGFARPVNNIAFQAIAENFLGQCLGGRAEPIGASLRVSTAQVRHGMQFEAGLKEVPQVK